MKYLELKGIYKHYDDFDIVVDFHIDKGELFTLSGPSGCGKTTLLRIIAGFIKPDKGNIFLSGKDITNLPPRERNISIVFQNYALFPNRNVYKNITYGPESKRWAKERIEYKAESLLSSIKMEKYGSRNTDSLSGGEKQRVALARAIAAEPEILLLDEPLSALDVALRNTLRTEIREIHERTGLTTIYVTHDQEEALSLSDRICVMNNGRIEQTDSPFNLYHNPKSWFASRFVGESNILSIKGIKNNSVITDAGLFEMPERVIPFTDNENKSYLFFRPEYCQIKNSKEDREDNDKNLLNNITVKIVKKVFLGSYYRIEAQSVHGESSKITLYDYYPYKTLDKEYIRFRIDPEKTICFK
ncbi:MAG: ABC transporter ATP-binding protein [Spirochaetia bacterium]|jgi:ABC-type Fe3+/spermidine/putrescine transport system ATPase subunit|nr:ABC transporter ATP-binding protein [Spirochaetia bacterium]